MALRFSLRSLCRDVGMILVGTVMGILLVRGYMQPCSNYASLSLVKREIRPGPQRTVKPPAAPASQQRVSEARLQKAAKGRPRTLADELAGYTRKPLFVGVVTAQSLLPTRALAVNQTWGAEAPKLTFFSSAGSESHGLPVVSLPGVDDTYPPQKKVYRMLKYMHDHFIDQYNWFMRADDDIYVRMEPLLHFLSKLDHAKELYVGQPGAGRPDDLKRVQLQPHEHYCMGGPGVLLSRALLRRLGPHLDDCLQHVVLSWNEDLEVGRCISRRLGVQCTWNYEVIPAPSAFWLI